MRNGDRRSRKKRTIYGSAHQEDRNAKVISAYRVMNPEHSLQVKAAVKTLDWNEDLLEYEKVPGTHKAFIIDPHLLRCHFRSGFERGSSFPRALNAAKKKAEARKDRVSDATISDIVVRDRKHVFAVVASKIVAADTIAMKEVLEDQGLRGIDATRAAAPMIYLAQLKPGVIRNFDAQQEYTEALQTALKVEEVAAVSFGPVQVLP